MAGFKTCHFCFVVSSAPMRAAVTTGPAEDASRYHNVGVHSCCWHWRQLLSMSLWFSGFAVLPALRLEWTLDDSTIGWLTIAVQLGFVVGTLLSAFLNLPDILTPKYLVTAVSVDGGCSERRLRLLREAARVWESHCAF